MMASTLRIKASITKLESIDIHLKVEALSAAGPHKLRGKILYKCLSKVLI